MSIDIEQERLNRRVAELLATDPQFAAARPDEAVTAAAARPGLRLPEIVQTVLSGYADRPALGRRAVRFVGDAKTGRTIPELLGHFETLTYRELFDRVSAVATAWRDRPVRSGDRVAILGFTSVDYTTVDTALALLGAVSVPLQTSAPLDTLRPIAAETEPTLIASSVDHLDDAVELALATDSVVRLTVFDHHAPVDDHREAVAAATERLAQTGGRVVVDTLSEVLGRGAAMPATTASTAPGLAEGEDPLALLIYTSGSTGAPKGAMYPESKVADMWRAAANTHWDENIGVLPSITLSFLPMSHVMGRGVLYASLSTGGTVYFAARSDLSTFTEDLALVRPTQMNFVPRIWDMIYAEVSSEVDRRAGDGADRAAVEAGVLAEKRQSLLGGRFVTALTGSAPISPELKAWVENLLDMHLLEGYGSTEAGAVFVDGQVRRPPVIDYKLVDVPELGYFRTDRPHPRGELLVKSEQRVPGLLQAPRDHRRDVRRRGLSTAPVTSSPSSARTSCAMSTGATTCSNCPRASSSPSPSWRPRSATARWCARSTSTATALGPICWPSWCPPRRRSPRSRADELKAPHRRLAAGRGARSRVAVLRDPPRLPHRDDAVHRGERAADRDPQAGLAQAQGALRPRARAALHRAGRGPGQRAAGAASARRRRTGARHRQPRRQPPAGRGGGRAGARRALHRSRRRLVVGVDLRQPAAGDLRRRGAGGRDRQPGHRPGHAGRVTSRPSAVAAASGRPSGPSTAETPPRCTPAT